MIVYIYVYCRIIETVTLVHTFFATRDRFFLVWVIKILRSTYLDTIKYILTILLTVVTVLYILSLGLTYLNTGHLYTSTNIYPQVPSAIPGNNGSALFL